MKIKKNKKQDSNYAQTPVQKRRWSSVGSCWWEELWRARLTQWPIRHMSEGAVNSSLWRSLTWAMMRSHIFCGSGAKDQSCSTRTGHVFQMFPCWNACERPYLRDYYNLKKKKWHVPLTGEAKRWEGEQDRMSCSEGAKRARPSDPADVSPRGIAASFESFVLTWISASRMRWINVSTEPRPASLAPGSYSKLSSKTG